MWQVAMSSVPLISHIMYLHTAIKAEVMEEEEGVLNFTL